MISNVRRTVNIFMTPAKYFGLFPISCFRGRSYRVSVPLLVWSSVMCLTYTAATVCLFCFNLDNMEKIVLNLQLYQVNMVLLYSVPILSVCRVLFTLKAFNEGLCNLEAAELQLLRLGRYVEYDTWNTPMVINGVVTLGAMATYVTNSVSISVILTIAGHIFYYYSLLGHVLVLAHWFIGVVGAVTELFRACNKEISLYSNDLAVFKMKKLQKLVGVHNTLCTSSKIMNEVYGVHLSVIFLTCFIIAVSEAYRCIHVVKDFLDENIYLSLGVKLCWIGVCFNNCFQIVTACRRCAAEAKEFNTLLYQLMLDDKTNDISNNQKLRLHIAMKREVVFTACGFFKLDYTLVHSMIAAATTYLVILIQFGQPSPSPAPATSSGSPEFLNTTAFPIAVTSPM